MADRSLGLKRNLAASWIAHAITLVAGFFLVPFVNRVLGDEQYGSWLFINSFASYSGLLYFGFGDTICRYVAKHHSQGEYDALNRIIMLVLTVYTAMAGVALLLAAGLAWSAPWITGWGEVSIAEVRVVIACLGLQVAVSLVGSVFGGVLIGLRRFDLERAVSVASDFARLAMLFGLLGNNWGLATIAGIYLVITICENVAYFMMARQILPEMNLCRTHLSWQTMKDCSSFSTLAFINAISMQLTYCTDTIVIGSILGKPAIVPYYVALRLAQFIKQPIEKIAQISMPTAGALDSEADRHKLQKFLLRGMGLAILLSGGAFIGSCWFGDDVISVWMGPTFTMSHTYLLILLGAQLIALPTGILRQALFGLGLAKVPTLVYLAEALTNLALSVALCFSFEQLGVALGTLIPIVIFELCIILPYALRTLSISWLRLFRDAVAPQLLPLAALAAYSSALSSTGWPLSAWLPLLAVTAGAGAVLAASLGFSMLCGRMATAK